MTALRITLLGLGASVVLVLAGCGGSSQSVPPDAVAVVDGTTITKQELDGLVAQTKRSYEARKQQFPKAGTPEFQNVRTQLLQGLVQYQELKKAADERGIEVTSKDVDKSEKALIDGTFGGKRSEYEKALKAQGSTAAEYRTVLEHQALAAKLFDAVTKDVTVSDKDLLDFYTQNQANYPAAVDYVKSKVKAAKIYAQLKAGANFAALAKANSDDPGSRDSGGKLTIKRGETVPEFEKVAFALKVGEISKPVRTQFGYHVIQALSPVKAGSRNVRHILIAEKGGSGFEANKEAVRQTLLQQRRNDEAAKWVEKLAKDSKVTYATGFEPPQLPEVPTTATE